MLGFLWTEATSSWTEKCEEKSEAVVGIDIDSKLSALEEKGNLKYRGSENVS